MPGPAVILVSGGLDSATILAIAASEGFECHAVSFRYGQRHELELDAAIRVCRSLQAASHRVIDLDTAAFAGSSLTGSGEIPRGRSIEELGEGIPSTYVPARNLVFLSYALGIAEGIGSTDLFIGVNAVDYSGYPDCRPAFIESFRTMANLATRIGIETGSIRVHAPLQDLGKGDIIRRGLELGVDYGLTVSCYAPGVDGTPCGECDSCILRARGFAEAGIEDPLTRRCS
ncbi:MAG: 7-cyano-7-deazaguanine synthase QueC [Planctomycetota bacterium]|nr:7-cyano-7-deazaguanine synthase QueC [Planctomycetota bacterium]